MPLYQYQCQDCGRLDEEFGRMSDASTKPCGCGGRMLRLIGAPAIHGTLTSFLAKRGHDLRTQLGSDQEVKRVTDAAIQLGYTPKASDIYMPTLADCPGDPKAFLPQSDPLGHARRICEKKGLKPVEV